MSRPLRWAVQLPSVAATLVVAGWLVADFRERVRFPFDLEWMEGGLLSHVWRLRRGLGLYVEPSADFVPYFYTPLYPWLLSLLSDPSYAVGRAVSLLGIAVAACAASWAARREGAPAGLAIGAAGIFLSCYEDSGAFYDLVRVDGLALGLAACALVSCRAGTRSAVIAGGLLLALAHLAKQGYAVLGLPILWWLARERGGRRATEFALAAAGPALLVTAALQLASDGSYLRWVVSVPSSQGFVAERFFPIAELELASATRVANAALAMAAVALVRRRRALSEGGRYWLAVLATALVLSIFLRAQPGGYVNVLMPAHWALATCAVLALAALSRDRPIWLAAASLVVAVQIWDGRWDRERLRPTASDRAAGEAIVAAIAAYPGEVLAPEFPWYPALAGKAPSVHLVSLWDIDREGGPFAHGAHRLDAALAARRWDAVLTSERELGHGLDRHYRRGEPLAKSFGTRTGWPVAPHAFWEPVPADAPPD